MYSLSCILRKITPQYNSFGAKTEDSITETEVPILRKERMRISEFYQAQEQGMKPELRIIISNLSYNGEQELEYMGEIYSIIRTDDYLNDMLIIAQRKMKNIVNEVDTDDDTENEVENDNNTGTIL